MIRFLPIAIFLLSTFYFLSTTSVFAQGITPSITVAPKLAPQANEWDNFISNLIPDILKQVNCGSLPQEVCQGISQVNTTPNKDSQGGGLKTQVAGEKTDKKDAAGNAAGQYVIASGIHTPPEVSQASTNIIFDIFAWITKTIGDLFKRGEDGADNYAKSALPDGTVNQVFDRSVTNMDQALPLVQCAGLPSELCTDNKPNAL